jgi:NADH-quinone oxidoreductase subunit M
VSLAWCFSPRCSPVAVLVSRRMAEGARLYFVLVLLLESAMFGVSPARSWTLFYVFWEATLFRCSS